MPQGHCAEANPWASSLIGIGGAFSCGALLVPLLVARTFFLVGAAAAIVGATVAL